DAATNLRLACRTRSDRAVHSCTFSKLISMPNNELNSLVLRRFESAQTLAGRFLLNLHVEFQRFRASRLSNGGVALKRAFDIFVSGPVLFIFGPLFGLVPL